MADICASRRAFLFFLSRYDLLQKLPVFTEIDARYLWDRPAFEPGPETGYQKLALQFDRRVAIQAVSRNAHSDHFVAKGAPQDEMTGLIGAQCCFRSELLPVGVLAS